MKRLVIACVLLVVAGCMGGCVGGLGGAGGLKDMSAEQIKAAGKDANVVCVENTSIYGRTRAVYVNVDQTVIDKGGIDVDKDSCGVSFKNERQFRPAPGVVKAPLTAGVSPPK